MESSSSTKCSPNCALSVFLNYYLNVLFEIPLCPEQDAFPFVGFTMFPPTQPISSVIMLSLTLLSLIMLSLTLVGGNGFHGPTLHQEAFLQTRGH